MCYIEFIIDVVCELNYDFKETGDKNFKKWLIVFYFIKCKLSMRGMI